MQFWESELEFPAINRRRLHQWRTQRLQAELAKHEAAMVVIVNPICMRYAIDYRNYALFQTHIPSTYLFYPAQGKAVIHGAYQPSETLDIESRDARPISFFDGGKSLEYYAEQIAQDVLNYLKVDLGTDNRKIALEYVNPTLIQALERVGLEVIDGVPITEMARAIKSEDEITCIKTAILVAQNGIDKMKAVMFPGVSELQLWGILNYNNIIYDGDWHEGRMLASGPRINPWLQEATSRKICAGDLVGFDTDMIGPNGYFADISRTFFCGLESGARPTTRQKQLYAYAVEEVEHNLTLIKDGVDFETFRQQVWQTPEEFQHNAYSCLLHGVGMCDEYPQIKHPFRLGFKNTNCYSGALQAGMVVCVESYIGAVGEDNGVKIEQQVLVTQEGYELLSTYPYEDSLLS